MSLDIASMIMVVIGLCLFETVSSLDNAVINAEVLHTMSQRARRWFLLWGMLFAVFIVRGVLPLLIIWWTTPELGLWGALTATFSSDPRAVEAIESSAPVLLIGGGIFLVFLFFHWLFLEPKIYGLHTHHAERFFECHAVWFYAIVSIVLAIITWFALQKHPMMAFSAVIGSTAFFITHGFKQNAEKMEHQMIHGKGHLSDWSKIMYLEVIDSTFSIDGVLGAFAFTLSIPLILIGNGLGALVVRQVTVGNIERVKKYKLLKNGAMYSIFLLGAIMIAESFGVHIPSIVPPLTTLGVLGYFFYQAKKQLKTSQPLFE